MSNTETKQDKAVDTCSTGSCAAESSKQEAQKQADLQKQKEVEQTVTKSSGSCCGG